MGKKPVVVALSEQRIVRDESVHGMRTSVTERTLITKVQGTAVYMMFGIRQDVSSTPLLTAD